MRRQTQTLTLPTAIVDALLAALGARPAAALWATPTIRLMTSDVAIGPTTVPGDITEAAFDGYAAVAMTTHGPVNVPSGGRALLADADFVAGDDLDPDGPSITGYYITDEGGTPTVVYAGELFAEPVQFAAPGDVLALDVYIPLPRQSESGLEE